ncbi:MAG TPA: ABC transporter substrate-binding protein [Thermodesulfobacteriota bacterium]|jgi:branched-chain amino acid transport system substrate-binding protein|nr:ABC transporter substrate-binding protein [Thermodesulfobacteriota bacterium]
MKKKMNRRTFLKCSAAVGATTAISGFPTFLHAQAPEIKIASIQPVTGVISDIGISMRRGNQMAVDEINAKGGIKSMGGAKLKLLLADTEAKEEIARTEAERVIKEGAVCLVGPFLSGNAMTIATLCEQRGVPFVMDVAAADDITRKGFKYSFRVFPTTTKFADSMLFYMSQIMKENNLSKIRGVVTNTGDLFGRVQGATFVKTLKDKNFPIEVMGHIEYPLGIQDLSAEVSKIKALKPEVLFPVARPGDAKLMIRELYKQRVELKGIISPGSPGWYEPEFIRDMKVLADYVMDNVPWYNPIGKMYKEVNAAFSKKYPGKYIDTNSGYAYLGILVVADALERAKSTKPEDIVAALRKAYFKQDLMVGLAVAFDERGDNINADTAMIQTLGGSIKVVLPSKASEAKYVFPMPKQLWDRGM